MNDARPAWLMLESWAGRTYHAIGVIEERGVRYKITPGPGVDRVKLGGRQRWLSAGGTAWVPRHAVTFDPPAEVSHTP